MRVPLFVPCSSCREKEWVWTRLRAETLSWVCSSCGDDHRGVSLIGLSVGTRLLDAATYEWNRRDYEMCVIFAAMAFEVQLADTYKKWAGSRYEDTYKDYGDQDVEAELRNWQNIRTRLLKVAQYLDSRGVDEFVKKHPHLAFMVELGFPETLPDRDIVKGIERHLFWLRNRILHFGFEEVTQDLARHAFNISLLGFELVKQLDQSMSREQAKSR